MFTNKAIIFLNDGLTEKYWPAIKEFYTNENAALAVQAFA